MIDQSHRIDLCRIDAERGMKRFYVVQIEPTLFGEAQLVREWGRIGRSGQTIAATYADREGAEAAFTGLVSTKRRRGYVDRG